MFVKIPAKVPGLNDGPPARGSVDKSPIDMTFAKQAIAARLQQMVDARDSHIRAAQAEAAKSKNIHALTRHGYQTGWAGQLLRVCTKLTPDQEYDPLGTGDLTLRTVDHYADRTDRKTGDVGKVKMKPRTGGGVAAGHFYNPEIQDALMKESLAFAKRYAGSFPECEVRLTDGTREWRPYSFVHVYLTRPGGTGVAFTKTDAWKKVEVKDAVDAINDFIAGARAAPNGPLKYPTWKHLLDHLKVDQILRNGSRAEISLRGSDPCMMTMMPETVGTGQAGFAPTSLVLQKGESARFKGCRWTGGLRNPRTRAATSRAVPAWTEPFK